MVSIKYQFKKLNKREALTESREAQKVTLHLSLKTVHNRILVKEVAEPRGLTQTTRFFFYKNKQIQN